MLKGMGFDNNTSIYLASGKIYQAEKYLAPLLMMFPLLQTKQSLATPDELAPFEVLLFNIFGWFVISLSLFMYLIHDIVSRGILQGWLLWTTWYACIVKLL